MKRICEISGVEFEIVGEDLDFYKKVGVPAPRLCPEERARRRMSFANQRTLFHRVCAGSGKKIITNVHPSETFPVFDIEYWFSDKWDMFATGRDFDFSRPFFPQFAELMSAAPRPNLQRNPQYDENSDYTNYAGKNKNCYLIFDSDKSRDCLYCYSINTCTDVMDCFRCEQCELCYECIDCSNCYGSTFLQNCENCSTSAFLFSCIGCSNCFGCVNLRNKKHCFFNEQLSPEEYAKKVAAVRAGTRTVINKLRQDFVEFVAQFPKRFMQGVQNENVIGDYLSNSKNARFCFDCRKLWDCKYITQAFDSAKDCMDCSQIGDGVELFYECCYVGYGGHSDRFCSHCLGQTANLTYCYYAPHCADCFGCVGLHHAKFSILNKQYGEKEYRALVPKIIAHMERTGEWGEFFPTKMSPFPYNLTHAFDYFPLTREEALKRGYRWQDPDKREYLPATFQPPDNIEAVPDGVLQELLCCERSGVNYKIQKAELAFYRKLQLPVPNISPNERFLDRLKRRNPRKLYQRSCSRCSAPIFTTCSPDRPEAVLCEVDFQREVE